MKRIFENQELTASKLIYLKGGTDDKDKKKKKEADSESEVEEMEVAIESWTMDKA